MPLGSARRSCRAVQRLRPASHRLQFLSYGEQLVTGSWRRAERLTRCSSIDSASAHVRSALHNIDGLPPCGDAGGKIQTVDAADLPLSAEGISTDNSADRFSMGNS